MPVSLQQGQPYIQKPDPQKPKSAKITAPVNLEKKLKRKEKQLEVASYLISMQAADCEQKDKTIQLLKQELNKIKGQKSSGLNFLG